MKIIKLKKGFVMAAAAMMFLPLILNAAEQLLRKNPNDAGLLMSAGICAVNQRNYAVALEKLSRAAEIRPKKFLPAYLMGVIYEETGNLYQARVCFEKAVKNTKDKKKRARARKHLANVSEAIAEGK